MKRKGLFALLLTGFVLFLFSCTKLNSPTELGDELIPAVDNINTFDTTLEVQTSYHPYNDSSRHVLGENMALGKLNDPVFGTTTADMYFNLSSSVYGTSPFNHRDSVKLIDSVVLQLAYVGAFGDTSQSGQLNVQVSDILSNNGFVDTLAYRYDHEGFTTGSSLGTSFFNVSRLKDTQTLIRKQDTTKVANVLRIRLNNSLGDRLKDFDTSANGAYRNDSLFRVAFRGLAVKTTAVTSQGTLAYFNLSNAATELRVYYKGQKGGVVDSAQSAVFRHTTWSQANSISRTPGGEYLASLNVPSPQQIYIQSSPQGSYAGIYIPGLSSFPNRIIHRAELIAFKEPSAAENSLTPPNRLFLDHKGTTDSAFLFDNDIPAIGDGSFNLGIFGGNLRNDNSYRFNITRYVQGIVTRRERNDSLRLYAPLRTILNSRLYGQQVSIPVLSVIANGRVVLAGANHTDPARRLRLRIIYSNI